MSLKDDFLEALNSVKRDIIRDDEDPAAKSKTAEAAPANTDGIGAAPPPPPPDATPFSAPFSPPEQHFQQERKPDEMVFEAFRQADAADEKGDEFEDANDESLHIDSYLAAPLRGFDTSSLPQTVNAGGAEQEAGPEFQQEETNGADFYSDDKTVISRNTVIRGTLQTEDSVRLLGQIMGDIECKSNIVIAGKVRGNTSAANAFIMDAQVDGSVYCDDAISISNDAWILGNVRAGQADIDGKVKGNLEVRNSVSIGSTSSVIGNISTDELEIKRGAFVNGQIMMYTPSRDVLDRFDHFER